MRDGKYGPHVNFGKVNATLPKAMDPEAVTFDQAMDLIRAKQASSGDTKPARKSAAKPAAKAAAKPASDKKPAAKKAPAKKPAAKKPAAKKPAAT